MKSIISLSIFLAIAVIAWWTITKDFNDNDPLQLAKSQRYIEIFINEFELTAMNESGSPAYILRGAHLEKYNNSDNSQILQAEFHLLQQNSPWIITAEQATINEKQEIVVLKDNVVMQQQNIEPAITIRTQRLVINTRKQIAKTKQAVEITQGKSLMQSSGMVFNNITSELELSANVSGYFLPYD